MDRIRTITSKLTKYTALLATAASIIGMININHPIYDKLFMGIAIFSGLYFLHSHYKPETTDNIF